MLETETFTNYSLDQLGFSSAVHAKQLLTDRMYVQGADLLATESRHLDTSFHSAL